MTFTIGNDETIISKGMYALICASMMALFCIMTLFFYYLILAIQIPVAIKEFALLWRIVYVILGMTFSAYGTTMLLNTFSLRMRVVTFLIFGLMISLSFS